MKLTIFPSLRAGQEAITTAGERELVLRMSSDALENQNSGTLLATSLNVDWKEGALESEGIDAITSILESVSHSVFEICLLNLSSTDFTG